jgi:hypothetical protein
LIAYCSAMIGQFTMKFDGPHGAPSGPVILPALTASSTSATEVSRTGVWPGAQALRWTSHSGL